MSSWSISFCDFLNNFKNYNKPVSTAAWSSLNLDENDFSAISEPHFSGISRNRYSQSLKSQITPAQMPSKPIYKEKGRINTRD